MGVFSLRGVRAQRKVLLKRTRFGEGGHAFQHRPTGRWSRGGLLHASPVWWARAGNVNGLCAGPGRLPRREGRESRHTPGQSARAGKTEARFYGQRAGADGKGAEHLGQWAGGAGGDVPGARGSARTLYSGPPWNKCRPCPRGRGTPRSRSGSSRSSRRLWSSRCCRTTSGLSTSGGPPVSYSGPGRSDRGALHHYPAARPRHTTPDRAARASRSTACRSPCCWGRCFPGSASAGYPSVRTWHDRRRRQSSARLDARRCT